MPRKLTTEEVRERLNTKGFELLGEYFDSDTKTLVKCKCGNDFMVRPGDIFTNNTTACPKCRRKTPKLDNSIIIKRYQEYGLELLEEYKGATTKLLTRCICGDTFITLPMSVSDGKGTRCKSCTKKNRILSEDEIRKRLDKYGIEYVGGYIDYQTSFNAKCPICGEIFRPKLNNIIYNGVKSCAKCCRCRGEKHHHWSGYGGLSGFVFNRIRQGAKNRKLPLEIDQKYAWELFEKQGAKCYYTGKDISLDTKNLTASLDRIDSNLGYISGNVVWCFVDINLMKWDIPHEEFIYWCNLVANPLCSKDYIWKNKLPGEKFSHIRIHARNRGLEFNITKQDAEKQYVLQNGRCNITGIQIILPKKGGENTASLDRIDSSLGYTTNNIQWVHKQINKMKRDMDQDYFISLCKQITDYQQNREQI